MVISCSDSRVDPETIFSAMPGELFVVRNVANLVPPYETGGKFHGVSSAIEFAVLNLRIKHLIVMGHSGCGGVKAALDQSAAIQTEAQFISRWMSMLDDARLRVLASHQTAPHRKQKLKALEKEGVKTSIKQPAHVPVRHRCGEQGPAFAATAPHFDIASRATLRALNHLAQFPRLRRSSTPFARRTSASPANIGSQLAGRRSQRPWRGTHGGQDLLLDALRRDRPDVLVGDLAPAVETNVSGMP